MSASRLVCHGVVLSLLVQVALGCLPKDNRPPPGNLLTTASSDSAVQQGFDTDDGWHIQFTKFIVSPGHSSFHNGGACTSYSNASYEKVLNVLQAGSQKVNLIYALGTCDFGFRLTFPRSDALVGADVSAQDLLTMQTAGTDRFQTTISGANGYISGIASNQSQTKTFTWLFRQSWTYQSCEVLTDAGLQTSLQLGAYEGETMDIMVRGEQLFQNVTPSYQVQLLFNPIAQADSQYGNNDGDVTLDELSNVPISLMAVSLGSALVDFNVDGGVPIPTDLESFVYQVLYPSMFHYDDSGQCTITPGQNRGFD